VRRRPFFNHRPRFFHRLSDDGDYCVYHPSLLSAGTLRLLDTTIITITAPPHKKEKQNQQKNFGIYFIQP